MKTDNYMEIRHAKANLFHYLFGIYGISGTAATGLTDGLFDAMGADEFVYQFGTRGAL